MRIVIIAALALLLGGCSVFDSKQEYAGVTSWDFNYCKVDIDDATEDQKICGVEVLDGKERGSVQLDFVLPDGTIMNYLANDEAAFEGQRIRAEVEKAFADAIANTLPSMVDAAIKALVPVPDIELNPDG